MTTLMIQTERMTKLSLAYIEAVAASAGYMTSIPYPDIDSIDMQILSSSGARARVELQAKCTSRTEEGGEFSFQLSRKNYDELRITKLMVPRILVVVAVPADMMAWMTVSRTEETTLLGCIAYWRSLWGMPERDQGSVSVRVPRQQVLEPDTLNNMMNRIEVQGQP